MSQADECKQLIAWKNTMPGATPTLHVLGIVQCPTPCHKAYAIHTGHEKSNPPKYLMTLKLEEGSSICIQKITYRELEYHQPNYTGNDSHVILTFLDKSTKTVPIDEAT